jgi:NAD(P)-dependent dehydrogenase (short-subunit alcohol dehydrogenase family)
MAGLHHWTHLLTLEVAVSGVAACIVDPGGTVTLMQAGLQAGLPVNFGAEKGERFRREKAEGRLRDPLSRR